MSVSPMDLGSGSISTHDDLEKAAFLSDSPLSEVVGISAPQWNIDRAQVASLFKAEDTGGGRSDTGKLRYDLLPPHAIQQLTKILTFGCDKYTKTEAISYNSVLDRLKEELEQCQIVLSVKRSPTAEEGAALVMKSISEKAIPSLQNASAPTVANGIEGIQSTRKDTARVESLIPHSESETQRQNAGPLSLSEDSLKKLYHFYFKNKKVSAAFASVLLRELRPYTSIMTTYREEHEDIFVVVATTASDSLMTALTAFNEQLPTSVNRRLRAYSVEPGSGTESVQLTVSGAGNWEKGMAWSRCYASLMRHLMAWWAGEDKDPESNESHLAHAMCNLVFLMEYERTHPEKDDRVYKA